MTPDHPPGDPHEHTLQALTDHVEWLTERITRLQSDLDALRAPTHPDDQPGRDRPAPWVLHTPPASAEDTIHRSHTPLWSIENFVAWHNTIYIGQPGSAAKPIPACWAEHPALAAETATLAATWRHSNIGTTANPTDAQYWHHTWHPGFLERMNTWTHPRCHANDHPTPGWARAPLRFPHYPHHRTPDTTTQTT